MGQAKISSSESNIDDLVRKSEFPKLKTEKRSERESLIQEVSEAHLHKLNYPFWVSIVLLVAQFILFVLTLRMISVFRSEYRRFTQTAQLITSRSRSEKSPPLSAPSSGPEKLQTSKMPDDIEDFKPEKLIKTDHLMLGDFSREKLDTNLKSPIFVNSDKSSQKVLTISLDREHRYGENGASLRISYALTLNDELPAMINIDAANVDIANYRKLTFRLMAAPLHAHIPKLELRLINGKGDSERFLVAPFFSFWKKYEYDLTGLAQPGGLSDLQTIQLIVYPVGGMVKGNWYLDDIMLENN